MGRGLIEPHRDEFLRFKVRCNLDRKGRPIVFDQDYHRLKRLVLNYLRKRLKTERGSVMSVRLRNIEKYYGIKFTPIVATIIVSILTELNPIITDAYGHKKFIFSVKELKKQL